MNNVLFGRQPVPDEWRKATIVIIPKKQNAKLLTDHRGISLMSSAAKLFNRIILLRIRRVVDPLLLNCQNGFRRHRSTIQHIVALRRICEESLAHRLPLIAIFVDFSKAFDSVNRARLEEILQIYGIPNPLRSAICALYQETTACVRTREGDTQWFNTESGILQGDTLAPFLFLLYMDLVIRATLEGSEEHGFEVEKRRSSRYPGVRVAAMAYADDVVLLSSSAHGAQQLLTRLENAAHPLGLRINTLKTQALALNVGTVNLATATGPVLSCENFVYLGASLPCSKKDFARRRALAWSALGKLEKLWKSPASDSAKGALYSATIQPVLTYGAESWPMAATFESMVDGAHFRMLRAALGIQWQDHVTNREITNRTQTKPPSCTLRLRRSDLLDTVIQDEELQLQPLSSVLLWCPLHWSGIQRHRIITFWESFSRDADLEEMDLPTWLAAKRRKHEVAKNKRKKITQCH
jgi:hypothetical protein